MKANLNFKQNLNKRTPWDIDGYISPDNRRGRRLNTPSKKEAKRTQVKQTEQQELNDFIKETFCIVVILFLYFVILILG